MSSAGQPTVLRYDAVINHTDTAENSVYFRAPDCSFRVRIASGMSSGETIHFFLK